MNETNTTKGQKMETETQLTKWEVCNINRNWSLLLQYVDNDGFEEDCACIPVKHIFTKAIYENISDNPMNYGESADLAQKFLDDIEAHNWKVNFQMLEEIYCEIEMLLDSSGMLWDNWRDAAYDNNPNLSEAQGEAQANFALRQYEKSVKLALRKIKKIILSDNVILKTERKQAN